MAEHPQREQCANMFDKLFTLVARRVPWWVFSAIVAAATAAIVCLLFLQFGQNEKISTVQREQTAALAVVDKEVTRRAPILENLVNTQLEITKLVSELQRNPDPGLQKVLERMAAIEKGMSELEKRMYRLELLLDPAAKKPVSMTPPDDRKSPS